MTVVVHKRLLILALSDAAQNFLLDLPLRHEAYPVM